MNPYPSLFEPINIRGRTIRNRVVCGSHSTQFLEDNKVSDRLIAYYAERAKGSAGLLVTEGIRIHPTSMTSHHQTMGYDPGIVPGFRRLADALHAHGTVVFAQLIHSGRSMSALDSLMPLWGPSGGAQPGSTEVPHEMTTAEIREVVDSHALAARHVMQAGLDGIEIQAAHGYLLHHFMSPLTNRRTDRYGDALENRLRLSYEVIDAVRDAVGPDVPIGLRLLGEELTPGGLTLDSMKEIAPLLVARGVDYLSISVARENVVPDMNHPLGVHVRLATAIRSAVRAAGSTIPVMAVGRILHPDHADRIIAEQQADMVVLVRALIADPEWAVKAQRGDANRIRPCLGCNQGCLTNLMSRRRIACTVNAAVGHEAEWREDTLTPAPRPTRVLVVGAGPAGLEAARVAATRGHSVTVWERRDSVGGQVATGSRPRTRAEFGNLVLWLDGEVRRLGVRIDLGRRASARDVLAAGFDTVIVATGSTPVPRRFEGDSDLPVLDVSEALADLERAARWRGWRLGARIVILDEDRHHKAGGLAEELGAMGRDVTMVCPGGQPGDELTPWDFFSLRVRLGQKHVAVRPFSSVVRIDDHRVTVRDQFSGIEDVIRDVDSVVVAAPYQANDGLVEDLSDAGARVFAAGDCVAPRRALEAVREGHQAGRMA